MSGGLSFERAQIVILSSIEWAATWQRHQTFARQWAEASHEVFFVENTGFRDLAPSDLPRLWRKALRLFFETRPRRHLRPPPNLHVVNPLVLPPTRAAFRRLNAFLLVPRLVDQLRSLGLGPKPVVVAYLPTATTLELLEHLQPSLTVYDCVDNFRGLPSPPRDLAEMERELLARSDKVLTTSRTLFEDKARLHPDVLEIHHGVGPEFFLPGPGVLGPGVPPPSQTGRGLPGPGVLGAGVPPPSQTGRGLPAPGTARPCRRLCYFGTLWHAVDYEPLKALAEAGFEVTLIGPQKEPPPALPPGVRLKPAIPYASLPRTLAEFDGLLLPYVASEYNRGVIPAKIYECLATGKPVFASPLPALEPLRDFLYIARTPADWVSAARSLETLETGERRRSRVERAREHAHAAVFARLTGELRASWARKHPEPPAETRPAAAPRRADGYALAFLRGFTWIGLLYGMAKASTLLTQVLAGRWLGPLHYGKANLVLAAAAYLQILPMMGFPLAISKFVSEEEEEAGRRRIISTAFMAFALWGALWLAVLAAGAPVLARKLKIPGSMLELSVIYAYFMAFYVVVSSPLLGLRRFEHRGLAEAFYGLSAPLLLALLVSRGAATYEAMIWALCLSLGAGALYALWVLRESVRPAFDTASFRLIFRYAAVATFNLLAMACILGPARLILHHYDSAREVGIFSAYFTSTAQISLAVLYMLSAVIVPLASSPEGQSETWRSFKRLCLPLWLGAWAFFLLAAALALSLFGRQYPFHLEWAALFGGAASLILVHGVAAALYAARDFEGLCVSVAGSLVAGLGNVGLGLALIPRLGITGAALSLVGAYLLGLATYAAYALKVDPAGRR